MPDYGVDGSVEVFDDHGKATGRLFFVQLKATEADLGNALAVTLRTDTLQYYRSLDLPVLIVRYHSPTRKIYVRWFHQFDPYYARIRDNTKTITFRLSDTDEWNASTPATLSHDLDALRQIKSPRLPLPLVMRLAILEPHVHGVPAPALAMAIRERAAEATVSGIIRVTADASSGQIGSIEVSGRTVVVMLPGKSFTLHTDKGYPGTEILTTFPSDVLLSVALALDHAGHSETAARLIAADAASGGRLISDPVVIGRVVGCMARAQRVTEALQLSERLESNEPLPEAGLLLAVPLLRSETLSAGEREYVREFLNRRIARTMQSGNRLGAAADHYNLANHLKGHDDRLALHHYRRALRLDPVYWNRPYLIRELAGVLFEARRYRLSSVLYRHALNLGADTSAEPLLADALMFAGRYAEAEGLLDAHIREHHHTTLEWHLKSHILSNIRQLFHLDSQARQSRQAFRVAMLSPVLSEDIEARMEQALKQDALCSVAWFNLGVARAQHDRDSAMFCFTSAAVIRRWDVTSWAHALVLSLSSDNGRELGVAILTTAYRLNGERFTAAVAKIAEAQPEGFDSNSFLGMLDRLISTLPPKEQSSKTLRFLSADGYDELDLGEHSGTALG